MSWLNIVSISFLMCVFPNLDKANMDLNPKSVQSEHGTSDSIRELMRDLVSSLK